MRKFLSILFILGFIVYLKPEFKLPDGETTIVAVRVDAGNFRITRVVDKNGKVYYIPTQNILYIIQEK